MKNSVASAITGSIERYFSNFVILINCALVVQLDHSIPSLSHIREACVPCPPSRVEDVSGMGRYMVLDFVVSWDDTTVGLNRDGSDVNLGCE